MLYQILFIIFGVFLDKNSSIKLLEPKYEFIRIINYFVWSAYALYSILFQSNYMVSYLFITNTMILSYIYEMIYHTPDKGHMIHHLITILTQLVGYYSKAYQFWWVQLFTLWTYVALSSSILSSTRHLKILSKYKYDIIIVYKFYYVFIKLIAMLIHYYIFFYNWSFNINFWQNMACFLFFCVHLVQLYFIKIILDSS